MTRLCLTVPGMPHPQGSKRHVGGGRMIEASKHVGAYRATLVGHLVAAIINAERWGDGRWPATGACELSVVFHLPRPKHHYRQGKFAHLLRAVAPQQCQVGADLDKLVRAVGDALTIAGAVVDDKQIDVIFASKKWTTDTAFTTITLWS